MASFRFVGYGFKPSDCSIFPDSENPREFTWTRNGKKICIFPAQYPDVQYGCAGIGFSLDDVVEKSISHPSSLKIWITPEGKEEFFWGNFSGGSSQCWEEETKEKYDCINNACIKADEYDTPGIYKSLEECETVCGEKGCSGKCISNKEWERIKDLAKKIRNKNCG